ncbi:ShlB/FhaC/HecB family hemolysin secretion/activation protein [Trinickia caryophylli]|uniref:Hemolysin activation/secretion protein n=1 Tax=Trinickia caryophylli TaxID=28094 RepID=A0A1X7FIR9_TRICW|nr:ShlB/FhaC/HecB family hemolysin secretion/activation protein [Trinickia caryophylli]PMS13215.1 ShlB/FhaC/HecB family hemolysin secretion/activation protein [Trinickia caryophylli]TRX19256.1 ShlB/FhaC/HecB family hemolysin secretion/activation protein [Trinickia caryophylli]WQE13441.1 ShlB/FhaC/HecB family hemolysin secretion/activation protein [Trinickia caryophylli]SMF52770.1 hemolysin activation/secretion protein [Trinickia caryophylli]GLU34035.1 activator/secretion protein [Trinickia car
MQRIRAATILSAALALVTEHALAQSAPSSPDIANAARSSAQQQQLIEQQREAQQRERAVNAPAVRSAAPVAGAFPQLPAEKLCFRIDSFVLDLPATLPDAVRRQGASALPLDRFAFAREWLDHYRGQCIGKQGVERVVKGVSQLILSRGYVTTRVLVPEQDLSAGTLKLSLVPGVIRQLRFADPAMRGTWKSAFPARRGDLLNLRDLEQGLEQMKRVASQDVDMQIEPTEVPGESDVVIDVKRAKPWTVVASVDNAGTRATGKLQGNLSLGIDNPLGLNDLFNVGASQDLEFGDKRLGSHGFNSFYSVPWGYWTATLSGNANTYYQQIAGVNQTFVSSGNSQSLGLKLQRVLRRSQNDVFGVEFQLTKRWGASFIDDTEIPQQRRDNTFIEAGLTDRHYFGNAQFDGTLAYRQGIGWLGATPDTSGDGAPTYRLHMAVLDANLSVPFSVAGQNLRYVATVHGQLTRDTLFYIDDLTIGSRYTVRGFDGETMLAAERGFYWRNELQAPIGGTGQSAYAGIDYGRVYGPNTAFLAGTQLAGAVIGLRGGAQTRFGTYSYEVFAGKPLYKPARFETARVTVGFQLTAQF